MDNTMIFLGLTAGCCVAIPFATILYIFIGKVHDWWAERIGLGFLR
jgi:hypothetical protein